LQTDGLRSHEELNVNDLYLKGSYEFSNSALAFSLFYSKTEREDGDFTLFDFLRKSRPENLFGTISLRGTLSPDMDFEVSMRAQRQTTHFDYTFLSEGDMISSKTVDKKYGASARKTSRPILWALSRNSIPMPPMSTTASSSED
jgi:hypothetical protein